MNSQEFWKEQCKNAFNGNTKANDFVLFFEGCKSLSENGHDYVWKTTEYESELRNLACANIAPNTWSLPVPNYTTLSSIKSEARSQWHSNRQQQLKQHLKETINSVHALPMDTTQEQRLAHIRQFMKEHQSDLGSVPFIKGMAGFLQYQLRHKSFLTEWKMSEYVLSQNNEEAMTSYVRLLWCVLGLQLVYQDDEEDNVVIQIDNTVLQQHNEDTYTWRMNPDLDDSFLHQAFKLLSSQPSTTNEYKVTDIPRNSPPVKGLFQWLFEFIRQCLSFLHR